VPLFGQLNQDELANLAEEVDQVSFQDFKVNLKANLDDLIRKDKERSAQMDQLIGGMKSIRETNLLPAIPGDY